MSADSSKLPDFESLFVTQSEALRDPHGIFAGPFATSGITEETLSFEATKGFAEAIVKLDITLLISREYENLLLALSGTQLGISQSFFHLPHPSGIAVDPRRKRIYVAATRNPNQIIEFRPTKSVLSRVGIKAPHIDNILMPSRAKYFSGAHYFHDLAYINGTLYANSVGQNGIVEVDMNSDVTPPLSWWPKCTEMSRGKPDTRTNYIQLNSIAGGKTLEDSYFSASGDQIRDTRPGDPDYPVDGTGVIFSGKTRKAFAKGLTRPHSARIYKNRLFVDNSGYGEVGEVIDGVYTPRISLPGWTRGLTIVKDILFVGVSRVLPRFRQYAPGLKEGGERCGIYAIDLRTWSIIGSIDFPFGNQIFAIESISSKVTSGFLYQSTTENPERERSAFGTYQI